MSRASFRHDSIDAQAARAVRQEIGVSQREEAQEILRQLEPHAPSWIKTLRAYIAKLERKR